MSSLEDGRNYHNALRFLSKCDPEESTRDALPTIDPAGHRRGRVPGTKPNLPLFRRPLSAFPPMDGRRVSPDLGRCSSGSSTTYGRARTRSSRGPSQTLHRTRSSSSRASCRSAPHIQRGTAHAVCPSATRRASRSSSDNRGVEAPAVPASPAGRGRWSRRPDSRQSGPPRAEWRRAFAPEPRP